MAHKTKGRRPLTYQLQLRNGLDVTTPGADVVLSLSSGNMQAIDGAGADRNVDLPAEELAGCDGLPFWISNTGSTNDLIVRNDAAATIGTLTPGTGGLFACDGSVWVQVI